MGHKSLLVIDLRNRACRLHPGKLSEYSAKISLAVSALDFFKTNASIIYYNSPKLLLGLGGFDLDSLNREYKHIT